MDGEGDPYALKFSSFRHDEAAATILENPGFIL